MAGSTEEEARPSKRKRKWRIARKRRPESSVSESSEKSELDDSSRDLIKKLSSDEEEKKQANILVQDKLANAEKRLAEEMEAKKEKRIKFKAIIEEDEIHVKLLDKQIQDMQDAIKSKEQKIMDMKMERKMMPLFKKFGAQLHIAKSVIKKERMQDDLSILKSQCAGRRRRIQKYKTRIRYDLQVLTEPPSSSTTAAVNPTSEQSAKHKPPPRPVPACFFVGMPQLQSAASDREETGEVEAEIEPSRRAEDLSRGASQSEGDGSEENYVQTAKEMFGSQWSLSSINSDDLTALLTRELEVSDSDPDPTDSSGKKGGAESEGSSEQGQRMGEKVGAAGGQDDPQEWEGESVLKVYKKKRGILGRSVHK